MGDRLNNGDEPHNRSSSSSGANSPSPLQSPTVPVVQSQQQQPPVTSSSAALVSLNMALLTQAPQSSTGRQSAALVPSRNTTVQQFSTNAPENVRLTSIAGPPSQYVKLNVGGYLHYTTIATLIKHDSMLRAMFSGRMEVLTDAEGWVLIDRCGKHFPVILNFLRDGAVALPESRREILEILSEAKYFCIQNLIDLCQAWLEMSQKNEDALPICKIPIITSAKEEKSLLQSTTRPAIKLLLNRHNNKYSYTSQSDDNLLKNLELFDKLIMRFHERVLFIKDVGAANEVCSWTFYGHGRKVTEVCCTSIVYATDKKHTKVEFPEARIYEEAMNILLYEPETLCPSCLSLSWQPNNHAHHHHHHHNLGGGHVSRQSTAAATAAATNVSDEFLLTAGTPIGAGGGPSSVNATTTDPRISPSGYCSDVEHRKLQQQQQRAKCSTTRAAEI